jgi:hypothetical protein
MKNVTFSYPGTDRKVLLNLNFTIDPGMRVVETPYIDPRPFYVFSAFLIAVNTDFCRKSNCFQFGCFRQVESSTTTRKDGDLLTVTNTISK